MMTKMQGARTAAKNAKLTDADFHSLLLALLRAETESEVDAIIATVSALSDPANWLPLDGRDTNWNVTNNQSASGAKAGTELVTNMVDAILIRHCVAQGIDPRSPEAPRTMHEAVERFLGWKGGRMMEAMPTKRELAAWAQQNIVVAFSGLSNEPSEPSITFCDTGEGQHPHDFERTFLSLSAGNKKEIPFVQGQFNMGSSGVNSYCGTRKYKLIVSRKHTLDGKWGWTLTRQRPWGDLPVVEYFKFGGAKGEIPSFEADSLCPLFTGSGESFEDVRLTFGTAVKLYDFQVGRDFNDFNSCRRVFIEHLADTLMPVRILDMRVTPTKGKGRQRAMGIDARTFCGLEHHISTGTAQEDGDDAAAGAKGAARIDVGSHNDAELGTVSIRAYYSPEPLTSRSASGGVLRSINRVFHTVNGQIQHRESRGFLTGCGLPALKDHLVVIVDASHLTRKANLEMFKADREMLKRNKLSDRYLAVVKDMVESNPELKRLNEETQSRQITNTVDKVAKNVLQKMVDKDRTLASLLSGRLASITLAGGGEATGEWKPKPERPAYQGTYSPEFFEVSAKASGIEIPRGGSAIIQARTTVSDDYMVRDVHPGRVVVSENLIEAGVTIKRTSLSAGRMILSLTAPEEAPLGEMTASIGLTDASMEGEVARAEFLVRIVEAKEQPKPKERKKPEPKHRQLSMPDFILLTRDGRVVNGEKTEAWNGDWTDQDGGTTVERSEGGVLIKINYDNAYFQDYLQRAKEGDRKEIWTKFMLAMQVSCLGLERRISQQRESGEAISEEEVERLRRSFAAGFASVAPTIVDHMPRVMSSGMADAAAED